MSAKKICPRYRKIDGFGFHLPYARSGGELDIIGNLRSLRIAVDLAAELGQQIIQFLPLTMSSCPPAPYSVLSTKLKEPLFIDISRLLEMIPCEKAQMWIQKHSQNIQYLRESNYLDYNKAREAADEIFYCVWEQFKRNSAGNKLYASFAKFRKENSSWLNDHILYLLIKYEQMKQDPEKGWDWRTWPQDLKIRKPPALARAVKQREEEIAFESFLQWIFDYQFKEIEAYACRKAVKFMDDIPFSVEGAEVWINPRLFGLRPENGFRRNFSQGVPPDPFSSCGQYWQFFPYYFWDKEAVGQVKKFWYERFSLDLNRVPFRRKDHELGFYRQYLFTEDIGGELTLDKLKLWDTVCAAREQGFKNPELQTELARQVYAVITETLYNCVLLKEVRKMIFEKKGLLRVDTMVLVARPAQGNGFGEGGFRSFVVEKAVFRNQPVWDFLRIIYRADKKRRELWDEDVANMKKYLFSYGDIAAPSLCDSLRPCFFQYNPAYDEMTGEFKKSADKHSAVVIAEALGVVPDEVPLILKKHGIASYIPMVFGMEPWDSKNPYLVEKHRENSFVTFGLHDSSTIYGWWQKLDRGRRQQVLDYLFPGQGWNANDIPELTEDLQRAVLLKVYNSKSYIAVLLLSDILMQTDADARVNDPSPAGYNANWCKRMPKDCTLTDLLKTSRGESSSAKAVKAVNLVRYLKRESGRID